jgi:hypothetical protein
MDYTSLMLVEISDGEQTTAGLFFMNHLPGRREDGVGIFQRRNKHSRLRLTGSSWIFYIRYNILGVNSLFSCRNKKNYPNLWNVLSQIFPEA